MALRQAIAENLRRYMEQAGYDPDDGKEHLRLAGDSQGLAKTIARLLRTETYKDYQPSVASLDRIARLLGVETYQLLYKPKVTGTGPKATGILRNSAQRNSERKDKK